MAQLKAGSTIGGIEIANKNCSNFPTNLPAALIAQLKGDTGAAGPNGTNGANGTLGSAGSLSLSGGTLTITSP